MGENGILVLEAVYLGLAISFPMDRLRLAILFVLVTTLGCATISAEKRKYMFDQSSKSYQKVVRWSDFEAASSFIDAEEISPDLKALEHIKVTSYEVKRVDQTEDKTQVLQEVEIKYYKTHDNLLKTLRDYQVWEYDEVKGRWYLKTGLPDFR